MVVETEHGAISRHMEENGRPAPAAVLAEDDREIQKFIHDPALQAKQRQNGAHDDKSAVELLNLMPQAFVWKVESETPETITLSYPARPELPPAGHGGAGDGRDGRHDGCDQRSTGSRRSRDKLDRGRDDRLWDSWRGCKAGGTFDVERRQVAPGLWQITETHVHIRGRALFFKTIGEQEDEVKTDFTPVPPGTTLEQAVGLLAGPAKPGRRTGETAQVIRGAVCSDAMAKTPYPQTDRELIRRIERSAGHRAGYKQLIRELGLGGGRERRLLLEQLARITARGELVKTEFEQWALPGATFGEDGEGAAADAMPGERQELRATRDRLVAGKLDLHRDGYGFVRPNGSTNRDDDLFIPPNELNGAMQGDEVLVDEAPPGRDGRRSGRIARVLTRRNPTVVGIFH